MAAKNIKDGKDKVLKLSEEEKDTFVKDMIEHAESGFCPECSEIIMEKLKLRKKKRKSKKTGFSMDDYLLLSAAPVHWGILTSGL